MEMFQVSEEAVIPLDELRDIGKGLQVYLREVEKSQLRTLIHSLSATAYVSSLPQAHRVAACNAICGLIEVCLDSSHTSTKSVVEDEEVSQLLLQIYLDRYEYSKSSSMKQVLNTLVNILNGLPDACTASQHKNLITDRLLTILLNTEDHTRAKPALLALTIFISRYVVTPEAILEICRVPSEDFLSRTFAWAARSSVSGATGRFVATFFRNKQSVRESSGIQLFPQWIGSLIGVIQKHPANLHTFRTYLMPGLLQIDEMQLWTFLDYLQCRQRLGITTESRYSNGNRNKISLTELLSTTSQQADAILCATLQVGKEEGLIEVCDHCEVRGIVLQGRRIRVSDIRLGRFMLAHTSHEIRLSGLSLLVSSTLITQAFTEGTLRCLRAFLPHYHADTDAGFRSEVLSFTLSMIDRLRASTSQMARSISATKRCESGASLVKGQMRNEKLLSLHVGFIRWFRDFLVSELRPSASYQRHFMALRALFILSRSGLDPQVPTESLSKSAKGQITWSFHVSVFNTSLQRCLFDLLLDPFEDVRHDALRLLQMFLGTSSSCDKSNSPVDSTQSGAGSLEVVWPPWHRKQQDMTLQFLNRARAKMMNSGRADHADGVARIFGLLAQNRRCHSSEQNLVQNKPKGLHPLFTAHELIVYLIDRVKDALSIAKTDLSAAVHHYPIHGLFIALRYILSSINDTTHTVQNYNASHPFVPFLDVLSKVVCDSWDCVRSLLCNDAPEGFLPEDIEEDVNIDTQDLLSYAWRALKESSLLARDIGVMFRKNSIPDSERREVTLIEYLGDLSFTQLADLRHRGAFSTVAQTFAALCRACASCSDNTKKKLPAQWAQSVILLIERKASTITRRSAGIPALITGTLCAEPTSTLFDDTTQTLLVIAQRQPGKNSEYHMTLPKIHAMNSLKAIFTTNKLSTVSERYIVGGMENAAASLKSSVWPVRNCALMLFRSLIDRLLGTHEASLDAFEVARNTKFLYDRYPGLLDLLLQLLHDSLSSKSAHDYVPSEAVGNLTVTHEALFPTLDLLRRAPPTKLERSKFRLFILRAVGSSQWHVRQMAARTYVALYQDPELSESLSGLFPAQEMPHNAFHGRLICLKGFIRSCLSNGSLGSPSAAVTDWLDSELTHAPSRHGDVGRYSRSIFFRSFFKTECFVIKVAYLEVLNEAGQYLLTAKHDWGDEEQQLCSCFQGLSIAIQNLGLSCSREASGHSSLFDKGLLVNKFLTLLLEMRSGGHQLGIVRANQNSIAQQVASAAIAANISSCCWAVEEISRLILANSPTLIEEFACALIIMRESSGERLQTFAETMLCEYLTCLNAKTSNHGLSLTTLLAKRPAPNPWDCLSPSLIESSLVLWGHAISARRKARGTWTPEQILELRQWSGTIQKSLQEPNDFPLRYAAALSARSMSDILPMKPELPSAHVSGISFIIYDMTNDDDDEIRYIGAESTVQMHMLSRSLDNQEDDQAPTPPVARQIICTYLSNTGHTSPRVVLEALRRCSGTNFERSEEVGSVKAMLEGISDEKNALFAVEKQNLYVDAVRDTKNWSRVLKSARVHCLNRDILSRFTTWCLAGLDTLRLGSRNEKDGPLGWSSKAEVFSLGMQVIHSTDVLLDWRSKTMRVPVKSQEIRQQLVDLYQVGGEMELHPLWLQDIEAILKRSFVRKTTVAANLVEKISREYY